MNKLVQISGRTGRENLSAVLLDWYDRAGRELPWRAKAGRPKGQQRPDPYHVWLSEIMLQQTTVAAVIPYFLKFTGKWPDLKALAAAPLEDILAQWAGLGYYARARNLHKCAGLLVSDFGGEFPTDEQALLGLPGIGPYTAAAVSAIAFDRSATVVDGNVERVIARLEAIQTPLPGARAEIRVLAGRLTPRLRAGDYAQAIMDLGATVCRPKSPGCDQCPWRPDCRAAAKGIATELPRRQAKKPRPRRSGTAFWLECRGYVYLRRRPPKGLLGGMLEVPSSPWIKDGSEQGEPDALTAALDAAPVEVDWRLLPGTIRHTFTHFELELGVMVAKLPRRPQSLTDGHADGHADGQADGHWVRLADIGTAGLPSVMMKLARHAMGSN